MTPFGVVGILVLDHFRTQTPESSLIARDHHVYVRNIRKGDSRGVYNPVNNKEIFIVDDEPEVRDGLSFMFARAGYQATIFDDGRSFVLSARIRTPTCVLLDLHMTGCSGLEILKAINVATYAAPVLMFSGVSDIRMVVEAIRIGAFDFIEKRLGADMIVARVREAVDAWPHHRQDDDASEVSLSSFPGCDRLTCREREVLARITAAASNKEAAKLLGISPRTIEVHRKHIMQKLDAKNSVDLMRIVMHKRYG